MHFGDHFANAFSGPQLCFGLTLPFPVDPPCRVSSFFSASVLLEPTRNHRRVVVWDILVEVLAGSKTHEA